MRKLVIGMALASTVLATPALARDDSWYIEGDFGGTLVEDMQNLVSTGNGTLSTKTGYDVGGIVGYDFGGFRLEAEASYRRAGAESFSPSPSTNLSGANLDGSASALSFMVNGLLDFGPDDGLQGFVGGGAGIGRVKVRVNTPSLLYVDDSDSGFAWQALAGIRYPISDNVDLGLKYRLYNQDNVDLVTPRQGAVSSRFRSHSLMLTLGYNFGAPVVVVPPVVVEETPPPPSAPPPSSSSPPPPCNKGPYIVFFDWDKSDITPEAASILDSAVAAYGNCESVPIMLAGYTDRSGSTTYNQGLSERRNASVTEYLTSRGVPSGAITGQGFGESNNRVPTADGVKELQNRRVEITYGPGSGM
ncbi:outer membrane beta-barrel protein [Novosphingobium sp.]|uniref:OmpA family protein n=1 Tax=Novosphingobium sp. TaxID=1874826 RepID=UPI00286A1208|nr:outer membrane beta-barrel protein [Novosphingobium sp.]